MGRTLRRNFKKYLGGEMKLKSRILITPPSRLSPEEYNGGLAVAEEIAREWNRDGRPRMAMGAIILEKSSPKYEALRNLFLGRVSGVEPGLVKWDEVIEAAYSERELEQHEILTLHINGEGGLGGNAYADVYELDTCPSCALIRIRSQVRDLVSNLSKARKDFVSTLNFQEVLISSRLRALLVDAQVSGVEFRPVHHAHPSRPVARQYFQLVVHNVLKPLAAPKHTSTTRCDRCGYEHDGAGVAPEKPDPWTEIHYWLPGPWNEMHFPRSSYRNWDLMRTEVVFGGPSNRADPKPHFSDLLVNQRLFRLLRRQKITGFWVQPAHLDSVSH